jgi:hypothetical protein
LEFRLEERDAATLRVARGLFFAEQESELAELLVEGGDGAVAVV